MKTPNRLIKKVDNDSRISDEDGLLRQNSQEKYGTSKFFPVGKFFYEKN